MTRIVILQSIWEGIEALGRGLGTAGQVHRSDVLFICALEEIKYILINPVHQSGAFKRARHILCCHRLALLNWMHMRPGNEDQA